MATTRNPYRVSGPVSDVPRSAGSLAMGDRCGVESRTLLDYDAVSTVIMVTGLEKLHNSSREKMEDLVDAKLAAARAFLLRTLLGESSRG